MAVPTATALRQAIRAFLDQEGASSAYRNLTPELRRIDKVLGTASTRDDNPSPGHIAARLAGSTEKQPPAEPDTPGKDLDNVQRPGGDKPFAGIKRPETAKALATLRFKNDKHVHSRQDSEQRRNAQPATAKAKGDSAVGVGE